MGARRLGLALLAALVISLGITYVFYVRVMKTQASSRPKMKSVVAAGVAARQCGAGWINREKRRRHRSCVDVFNRGE